MKTKRLLFGILISSVLLAPPLPAATETLGNLRAVLKHAGGNRIELETALREVTGKDTEYLIAHASQYDLVNLTVEQITENMTYARKLHVNQPYLGEKLNHEMWREWVVPLRVFEEDLCLWRTKFYGLALPVIAGEETTAEVDESIHQRLWEKTMEGERQVKFAVSEKWLRSPSQILRGGEAARGELAVIYTLFLRVVGIPACHCDGGWWQGKDGRHLNVEDWDSQLKRWVATDDLIVPATEWVRKGHWNTFGLFATPGINASTHAHYTDDFSQMINTTANVMEVTPFNFQIPGRSEDIDSITGLKSVGLLQVAQAWPLEQLSNFSVHSNCPTLLFYSDGN